MRPLSGDRSTGTGCRQNTRNLSQSICPPRGPVLSARTAILIIPIRDASAVQCMFCLQTGGLLNKPLLSLTHARSRPALSGGLKACLITVFDDRAVAAARQADRAPAVSCQSGFAWRTAYKGRATFAAQPKASPVLPVPAATGVRGADRLVGLSWSSGAVCPRAAKWAGPGTILMQGRRERRSDARQIIRPIRYRA
jgi:hypothetical protein